MEYNSVVEEERCYVLVEVEFIESRRLDTKINARIRGVVTSNRLALKMKKDLEEEARKKSNSSRHYSISIKMVDTNRVVSHSLY